jgi:hypothetical protein
MDPAGFDEILRRPVQRALTTTPISPAIRENTMQFTGFRGTTLPAV